MPATGTSIRALAGRYQVHRRTIRQALADPAPPPRKPQPRRATAFDRLHEPITAMLTSDPDLTILQIWERLIDDHEAAIAYPTVRDVVTRLRRRDGQAATRQEQLRQPVRRPGLMNSDDHTIIATYGAEYRGIVQYYLLASDVWRLNRLRWAAETSMLKTLAACTARQSRKWPASTKPRP
jgi:hypothetical protein